MFLLPLSLCCTRSHKPSDRGTGKKWCVGKLGGLTNNKKKLSEHRNGARYQNTKWYSRRGSWNTTWVCLFARSIEANALSVFLYLKCLSLVKINVAGNSSFMFLFLRSSSSSDAQVHWYGVSACRLLPTLYKKIKKRRTLSQVPCDLLLLFYVISLRLGVGKKLYRPAHLVFRENLAPS